MSWPVAALLCLLSACGRIGFATSESGDAGSRDAAGDAGSTMDAGPPEPVDGGSPDALVPPMDAGSLDAGLVDSGLGDAGVDAGPPSGTVLDFRQVLAAGDDERAVDLDVSNAGAVWTSGRFAGITTVAPSRLTSAGADDGFVARFDLDGSPVSAFGHGGRGDELTSSVSIHEPSGDIFFTGRFQNGVDFGGGVLSSAGGFDMYLVSYTSAGAHRWSRRFGSGGGEGSGSGAVCSTGELFIASSFQRDVDFGGGLLRSAGSADLVVASYTRAGVHRWSRRYGGTGRDDLPEITCDGTGGVYVTGRFERTVDFGGGALSSAGGSDIFLAHYDDMGNHVRSARFGGSGNDAGASLAVDPSGNVLLTGAFEAAVDFGGGVYTSAGDADGFFASFRPGGAHRWSRRFGSTGYDGAVGAAFDPAGNAYVTGVFDDAADLGGGLHRGSAGEILVASYAPGGGFRWSVSFGGAGYDAGFDVAHHDPTGVLFVVGHFSSTVDFGFGPRTAGLRDAFLLRMVP